MRIRGNLLKQMTLTRSSRTEFHHVVIALYKGDHADQEDVLCSLAEHIRFHTYATDQKLLPLIQTEEFSTAVKRWQHVALGDLNLSQRVHAKRPAVAFLGNSWVIGKVDFSVEASSEHPFVTMHQLRVDSHVFKL